MSEIPGGEGFLEDGGTHLAWAAKTEQLKAGTCSQVCGYLTDFSNVQKSLGKRSGGQELIQEYRMPVPLVAIRGPDYAPAVVPEPCDKLLLRARS